MAKVELKGQALEREMLTEASAGQRVAPRNVASSPWIGNHEVVPETLPQLKGVPPL